MKCNKCNTENNDENKFCAECGEELKHVKSVDTKLCPSCGAQNDNGAHFCSNCGISFSNKHSNSSGRKTKVRNNKSKKLKKQTQTLNLIGVIKEHKLIAAVISAFLIFLVYQSVPKNNEYKSYIPSSNMAANSIANVMSDSVVASVVSKFNCSCGKCTDPLDVCTCETAAKERGFIEAKAAQKISAKGIFLAVVSKYGGLKSEYSSELEDNGNGLIIPPVSNTSGLGQVQ